MITIWEKISELLRAELPATEAFARLIAYCRASAPEAGWERFSSLPVEEDLARLERWLLALLSEEPPSSEINGLWFGLFDMVRPDDKATTELYLAGSERFTLVEEWHDWASSPSYWPHGRYANSLITDAISRLSAKEPRLPVELSDYALNLGYVSFFAAQVARNHRVALLRGAESRGVATGYDDGDQILIGVLTKVCFETIGT